MNLVYFTHFSAIFGHFPTDFSRFPSFVSHFRSISVVFQPILVIIHLNSIRFEVDFTHFFTNISRFSADFSSDCNLNPFVFITIFLRSISVVFQPISINNIANSFFFFFRMATVPLRLIWLRAPRVIVHPPPRLLLAAAPIRNRTTVLLTPPGSLLPL